MSVTTTLSFGENGVQYVYVMAHAELAPKLVWQARQWVMFCAKTIEAQAPYFWRSVQSVVKAKLPESATFGLSSPTEFTVHKPTYPAANLAVRLDLDARFIVCAVEKKLGPEVDFTHSEFMARFFLDDVGELYVRRGDQIFNPDSFAQSLVDILLKN